MQLASSFSSSSDIDGFRYILLRFDCQPANVQTCTRQYRFFVFLIIEKMPYILVIYGYFNCCCFMVTYKQCVWSVVEANSDCSSSLQLK